MVLRLDHHWAEVLQGHLHLRDVFFNPAVGVNAGIEPLLRGMLVKQQAKPSAQLSDDMRNHLFGNPGVVRPQDLQALNI